MTITAKVIAHSRHEDAPDLITLQMRYPRMIHAEFMTHRVFSRNASSSRAVPVERMIQDVIDDPAMPVRWGANQPGMQDAGDHDTTVVWEDHTGPSGNWGSPKDAWLYARDRAVEVARGFAQAGYHKQVVNRLLEPFGHISVVVTATEWDNFFALRCHPDADPTMRALAEAMRDAIQASDPDHLQSEDWHLPYVKDSEFWDERSKGPYADWNKLAMISAARCARVSYLNHDGSNPDIAKDLALVDRLWTSQHLSPFEHQAKVSGDEGTALWGNLTGWDQFRKILENQTCR